LVTVSRETSRAMPPSSGSVDAPPNVTSTPPDRTKSSRLAIPFQVKPPVMSAEALGVPCEAYCGVLV
jgi:hypothetical protein